MNRFNIVHLQLVITFACIFFFSTVRSQNILADEGKNDELIVEVLIFSGRPNPKWVLTDMNEVEVLRERLVELPRVIKVPKLSRLGFRGFKLHNKGVSDFPNEVCVFQGILKVETGETTVYFKDSKNLKSRLVSLTKKQKLEKAVLEALEDSITEWNAKAISLVLNKETLAKLGDAFPTWKIKQMTWPSVTEINSASVMVDDKLKASCIGRLQKYIKMEQLPVDLDNHLIAMKQWGLIRKESEQERLCDVFIGRFKKPPYVIHIQESPSNVIISVADERLADKAKADHKTLVLQTAATVLHEELIPDPTKKLFQLNPKATPDGGIISELRWHPPSAISIDEWGHKTISLDVTNKIGTFEVDAETNGRFVRFDIKKTGDQPELFRNPYLEWFGPLE